MTQYRFVMRSGPTVGKVYALEAAEITIGRDATNIVAINDAEVSRRHARMELRGPGYMIQDLGSTNGTFVNGTRITEMQALNPGDAVAFGEGIVLVYEPAMDANATVLSAKPPASAPTAIQRPAPAPVPAAVAPMPPPAPMVAPVRPPISAPAPVRAPVPTPPPAPVYSGQVPDGPMPMAPSAVPTKKKKFPIWLLIVIILLLIVCVCGGFFLIIDQLNLWCKVLPFLVPILGGTCA